MADKEFIATNVFDLLGDNDAGDDFVARMASMKVEKVADVSKPAKTVAEKKKPQQATKTPIQQTNTSTLKDAKPYYPQSQQNQQNRLSYNNNTKPFYPNNYNNNNRTFYSSTQHQNSGNYVNNVTNEAQPGQKQWSYNNRGNNRRYQNNAPYRTNFVRNNEVSIETDDTGSVKSAKSAKSEREQEEIERKLEAEKRFNEFKYDAKEEKDKRDELWKLNKLIDAKEEEFQKTKGFYDKEYAAGEISENTDKLWNKIRGEKSVLLKRKSEIREYLKIAEQKKMTLADYERIKEEKKKALEALKPSQNVRVEVQNQEFSGMVMMSKKGDDDFVPKAVSKVKTEPGKTEKSKKKFVTLQVVTTGGEAQNQSRNRNGQTRAVNPPKLTSEEVFPVLA